MFISQLLGLEPGSVTELISAIVSLVPGVFAVIIAMQSNKLAEESETRTREHEERYEQAELERKREDDERYRHAEAREHEALLRQEEQRKWEIGGVLQAWWVTTEISGKERWGLVISNAASQSLVFHEINITTTCLGGDKTLVKPTPVKIATLPPGTYFAEHGWNKWEPLKLIDIKETSPVMSSAAYAVTSITFTDHLGTHWKWTPERGPSRTTAKQ